LKVARGAAAEPISSALRWRQRQPLKDDLLTFEIGKKTAKMQRTQKLNTTLPKLRGYCVFAVQGKI
jgi:hypothetical protein